MKNKPQSIVSLSHHTRGHVRPALDGPVHGQRGLAP